MERYCPTCDKSFGGDGDGDGNVIDRCPNDDTRLVTLGDDPLVGRRIAGFTVRERIGAGGMGAVYRAWQESVGRDVALKIILPRAGSDAGAAKRFLREVKLASRLSQPNVVAVHDFGQSDDGVLYFAMELVRGKTLGELLRRDGPFAPARVVRVGVQLCDALEAAHRLGIVHRDLKPANVMILDEPPGRDLVKVLDFGLAKATGDDDSATVTRSGAILGTPSYMSPEAVRGEPTDARSDLYALGAILAELASGFPPFAAPTVSAVLQQQLSAEPVIGDQVPARLANVIRRLLAKSPSARHPSAALAREALTAATEPSGASPPEVAGQSVQAFAATIDSRPTEPPPGLAEPPPRSWRVAAAATTALGLSAAGMVAFGYAGPHPHDPRAWQHIGGAPAWGVVGIIALGVLALGREARRRSHGLAAGWAVWWLAIAPAMLGAVATFVGAMKSREGLAEVPAPIRFLILNLGMFEASACRFVGLGGSAALFLALAAISERGPAPTRGPRAAQLGLAALAALAAAALGLGGGSVLFTIGGAMLIMAMQLLLPPLRDSWPGRLAASVGLWLGVATMEYTRGVGREAVLWASALPRADRAAAIVAHTAEVTQHRVIVGMALAIALGALWLPASRAARPRLGRAGWALVAAYLIANGFDLAVHARFLADRAELRQALAPQFDLFARLDPPASDLDAQRFQPHTAPALQIARDAVAIDGQGVARLSALGGSDAALNLGRDLAHALANAQPGQPDLLVAIDRNVAWSDAARVLAVAERAGARHLELLLTRGQAPVLPPDAPPEASYALASDFVAIAVELSPSGRTLAANQRFGELAGALADSARAGVAVELATTPR